jgi:hypothetical protein
MTGVECNILTGSVTISQNSVTCNGQTNGQVTDFVAIVGTTTDNKVSIADSQVQIELRGANIESQTPFVATNSNVSLLFTGVNQISATTNSSGIGCSQFSNLSFSGLDEGLLSVSGWKWGTGIGPSEGESCGSLWFFNGTSKVAGGEEEGSGIGC